MKALRFYAPEDVRLEDVPEPVCGPTEVKIKAVSYTHLDVYKRQIRRWTGLRPSRASGRARE